ncbi:P-loop containing nucleoside triphosphate hydrolase protein [Scleroderma citrinum]
MLPVPRATEAKPTRTPSRLRRRKHGIYEIAFEDDVSTQWQWFPNHIFRSMEDITRTAPYAIRLFIEIWMLAPTAFSAYILSVAWSSVSSAVNLYFLSVLLHLLDDSFTSGTLDPEIYRFVAIAWLSFTLISVSVHRMQATSRDTLCTRLRAHFIPQLIGDFYSLFPVTTRFESEFPGGSFITQFSQLTRNALAFISQVAVLLHAISYKQRPEKDVLVFFCVAYPLVRWFAPQNGIGSSAYIFWTENSAFRRMKALFGLTFCPQYRSDLILDGLTSCIDDQAGVAIEYEKSAKELGDVNDSEPYPWSGGLSRHWIWDFLMNITVDLPLAIYALTLPTRLSPTSITSMALLQQATSLLSLSIGEYSTDTSSLNGLCAYAKWLYDAIHHRSSMPQGTEPYPCTDKKSSEKGMKISFKGVCLQYPGCHHDAVRDVSFEIQPGQLVLVVGVNGSGKSSMLKLLARLFDPSKGQIFVDDKPLTSYDADKLRAAMSFLPQAPVVYPVSVRENISLGLLSNHDVDDKAVEEAAWRGGCSQWISRLNDLYDTQLQPSFDINSGWSEGMYGILSEGLKDELARNTVTKVSISGGEKQRLAAARTFMRLEKNNTKLVVVDEATSSLDPVAERDILSEFRRSRQGKTLIFVTHRFHQLVRDADQILCMRNGSVIECGSHETLLGLDGEYARLYNAQTRV